MRQPTARHVSGWQSQVWHKLTVFAYLLQYSLCGSSWSKVQYTTKNWISHLTNYCMLSWRSPTNRDWTALLLAHVHQSSMAVYNWSTRSTVQRHQLYLLVTTYVRMKFRLVMTYVWKDTMSFIQVVWKGWLNTKRCRNPYASNPYHNRAANNTRQCTPTHNQPQSVKSQKGTWTHNKLLVLVNNCHYTNTALPAQPSDQWLATYVPPSSHVHVQYTTIATSHKTLLDLLDVRVQLQFKRTHLVTSSWI